MAARGRSGGSALQASRAALGKHAIVTRLPADLPLVRFDATLIERVLGNLLENAAKYAPETTPETTSERTPIEIAAHVTGAELEISVADHGPGVPAGKEELIFEKFTRGQQESATPGVGLGLAICRAIVHAHQGRIWLDRTYTGGARFCFTLPLGTPPAVLEGDGSEPGGST